MREHLIFTTLLQLKEDYRNIPDVDVDWIYDWDSPLKRAKSNKQKDQPFQMIIKKRKKSCK